MALDSGIPDRNDGVILPEHSCRSFAQSSISRADLLRLLAAEGEQGLQAMAFALGYAPKPERAGQDGPAPPVEPNRTHPMDRLPSPEAAIKQTTPSARFFCVTERIPLESSAKQNPLLAPDWFVQAQPLACDERPDPATLRLPARLPLTCWARLWPFLRRVLGQTGHSRQLDIPRVIRAATQGEVLRRLPWKPQHQWSTKLCILLDYTRQTQPYREDFNTLCLKLESLHGSVGLAIRILHGEPGWRTRYRAPNGNSLHRWQMPDAQTRLLILSDVGLLDATGEAAQAWRLFGYRLRAAGCRPVVLCPALPPRQPAGLSGGFDLYAWDRHSRFQRGGSQAPALGLDGDAAELLLALAAPAIVIEPALLRNLRHLVPATRATAAAEAQVWLHIDIAVSSQGCCFATPEAIAKYQAAFQTLDLSLQQQAVAAIRAHHAGLPASLRYAELDVCERLVPGILQESLLAEVQQWKQAITKTAAASALPALREWQDRHLARHPATEALWGNNPELAALWAIAQRGKLNEDEPLALPPYVAAEQVGYFLQSGNPPARTATLRQRGQHLLLVTDGAGDAGSFFADMNLTAGVFVRQVTHDSLAHRERAGVRAIDTIQHYIPITQNTAALAELSLDTALIELETATEIIHIASLTKPAWAMGLGRDRLGLYAEVKWLGAVQRLDWQPPEPGQRGHWRGAGPLGVDEFGLYADLKIKRVVQRFRWIAPGQFLMGSPDTEAERLDWEAQHSVTLAQGYWLADTACTQALWQALIGGNPSRFQENQNNPVEQVSWDTVQDFIAKLNGLVPGLNARLPTEAEWEYACRAGTTTPFSFGGNITPDLVNYNGNYPYADGEKGLNREKTVPVKSLPPNPWGLYEMHGNVWEWCDDWFGDYGSAAQIDPKGPAMGAYRVLRGGSWFSDGRYVRSAYRFRYGPDGRSSIIGFRLALGQSGGLGQSAAPAPPGQPQAERRGGQGGASVAKVANERTPEGFMLLAGG